MITSEGRRPAVNDQSWPALGQADGVRMSERTA